VSTAAWLLNKAVQREDDSIMLTISATTIIKKIKALNPKTNLAVSFACDDAKE
jgi:hypothetical protein